MTILIQTLVSGVVAGAVYGLLGLGFSLSYKTTGIINFAHGQIAITGGYVAYTLVQRGVPLWVAALGAILAGAGVGALMERLALRPVYARGVVAAILVTVGVATVLQSAVQLIWGSIDENLPSIASTSPFRVGGVDITPANVTIVAVAVIVSMIIVSEVEWTRVGRAMRGCAQDSEMVRLLGVPAHRLYMLSFAMAGGTAGLAGVLIAPTTGLQPAGGLDLTVPGFAAAVLGGLGSLPGALLGGVLIGVFNDITATYISPGYSDAASYIAIALVLLVRVRGLFGDGLEGVRAV